MSRKTKPNQPETVKTQAATPSQSSIEIGRASKNERKQWFERQSAVAATLILLLSVGIVGAVINRSHFTAQESGTADSNSPNASLSFNNFLDPTPTPSPAAAPPQLSKEYIYAGSRMLAVEDANATTQSAPTDLAVWRPGNGTWYVLNSQSGTQTGVQWGIGTDVVAPGDFDGDGKTDFCVFRPSANAWYIHRSGDNTLDLRSLGSSGDVPAVADFDGDGRSDIAVFRPSNASWYWVRSRDGVLTGGQFGVGTDKPLPADYDGDGQADLAVRRDSSAQFFVQHSGSNQFITYNLGASGDVPITGDFDGDGKYDAALWQANNNWLIQKSTGGTINIAWGNRSTDTAVAGDYDADGTTDVAVWRNAGTSAGRWQIRKSSNGQTRTESWGTTGDVPVPAPYRR